MNFMERSWKEHCRRYPREFGVPWRLNEKVSDYVWNTEDLLRYCHQYNGIKNCYVSVYGFKNPRNYDTAIFDVIYNDFDDESDPQRAISDALKFTNVLLDRGIQPRAYWSGGKGCAVYLDFVPFDINPQNIKPLIALFQETIAERLNLSTMCSCTKDGQARISRIPNTKHMSSGLYCIPLTLEDLEQGLAHIKKLAQRPRDLKITINTENELPYLLRDYEKVVIKRREEVLLIKQAQELRDKLGLGYQRRSNGKITKCKGVLHAERGQTHPGREPTASGLILAYSNWYKIDKSEIKAKLRSWAATKCKPPRDWNLIEARIDKFYKNKAYTPCTFLMKYGHCKGSDCAVMQRRGG